VKYLGNNSSINIIDEQENRKSLLLLLLLLRLSPCVVRVSRPAIA